jgi:excisionase family DNA binding protein
MTPEQAAGYLGVAIGTIHNWTSLRYIPFARRGRVVRYHRVQIDRWLLRGACPGRSTIPDLE